MGLSSRSRKRSAPVVAAKLHRGRTPVGNFVGAPEQRREKLPVESQAEADLRRARDSTGWQEATIAWAVCASIHREYAKGKDPFYKTRQSDFTRHEAASRAMALEEAKK